MASNKLILISLLCVLLVSAQEDKPSKEHKIVASQTFSAHKDQDFVPEVADFDEQYLTRDGRFLQDACCLSQYQNRY